MNEQVALIQAYIKELKGVDVKIRYTVFDAQKVQYAYNFARQYFDSKK